MNYQSITNKSTELHSLQLTTNPDVVIVTGTEALLKPGIYSAEIFSPEYIAYRRNQTDTTGARVFILFASNFITKFAG